MSGASPSGGPPYTYECVDCGHGIEARHRPSECANCGGGTRNISVPREQ